ncbi:MAG: sugar phosphate isomerase/epimerase family protein [Bacillota bacterium]|nr:sugar phosphate isomerase/epimerase family protein [Bacillota bacterium]
MIQFVGHTMAVPGLDNSQVFSLFSRIGLAGIELVAKEKQKFHLDMSDDELGEVLELSRQYTLPVITITPYMWFINHPDEVERTKQLDGLKRAIDIASFLGARYVRAYGGSDKFGTDKVHFDNTVVSLRLAGQYAENKGIVIVVENHPGTLTPSGIKTAEMIEAVGQKNVRALFDPANALHTTGEDPMITLDSQKSIIAYVHCKDYYFEKDVRHACVVGEGIVPWTKIMNGLKALNYEGYVSFEYEKMWYPDDLVNKQLV